MLKKTIAYTDYDGNERKEDFYFNLTKAELVELDMGTTGGLEKMIQKIIETKDQPRIMELFKKIILLAYGEKSADGRRFVKIDKDGHKLADDFAQTEAYSELFMELATNDNAASAFVNGIIPANLNAPAIAPVANA